MQAVILVRVSGDPVPAEGVLAGLQFDSKFIRGCHAVIESVTIAFGTSHFIVVVGAATTEHIFRALRELRRRLNSPDSDGRTEFGATTSTLLGWDPETELSLSRVFKRACTKARERADVMARGTEEEAAEFIGRTAIEEYLKIKFGNLKKIMKAVNETELSQVEANLIDAIDKYLRI